ncbi:MAG: pyrroloquinoline quinone biosynthesis peptide chaperone PqqD [Paracoccus sp. (in: a-proteobacteria)]|nr:pyrroloquinoline quinone biosynthesis peptide chaperone PqqD [Paracoccus sp. (in: a-proteobacteria)]
MTALLTHADIPYLPRGVRLADDRVRGIRILHAPERALQLDAIGDAILSELDGTRSLSQIAATLAERYAAPVDQITADMIEFLTGLIERRMVFLK